MKGLASFEMIWLSLILRMSQVETQYELMVETDGQGVHNSCPESKFQQLLLAKTKYGMLELAVIPKGLVDE